MRRTSTLLLVLSIVASLYAHHGRGTTYDMKKRVTLKGTVDDSHGDVTSADVNNFADAVNNSVDGSKIEPKCWRENDERAPLFRNSQNPSTKLLMEIVR